MKTKLTGVSTIVALTIVVSFDQSAFAVEGGLGRPISGMQMAPFAGVIPPELGLAVVTGETYYDGPGFTTSASASASRVMPSTSARA